jgi:hypothetical protein
MNDPPHMQGATLRIVFAVLKFRSLITHFAPLLRFLIHSCAIVRLSRPANVALFAQAVWEVISQWSQCWSCILSRPCAMFCTNGFKKECSLSLYGYHAYCRSSIAWRYSKHTLFR